MGSSSRKQAKKKERERRVKEKVLARRERIRRKASENRKWDALERETAHRQEPVRNLYSHEEYRETIRHLEQAVKLEKQLARDEPLWVRPPA